MFEKQLGVAARGMYVFWTIFCLAQAAFIAWVAVVNYSRLPLLATVGLGAGVAFALAFAVISAWIVYSGRMKLKVHQPLIAGLVWAFVVILVTIFMVSAPNSIVGLRMIVSGLVFLVGAAAFLLASRTEQAELRVAEERQAALKQELAATSDEARRAWVEMAARRHLNLAYPGETVYLVNWTEPPAGMAPAAQPAPETDAPPATESKWQRFWHLLVGE